MDENNSFKCFHCCQSYLSLPVVSTLPLRRDLLMCVSSLRSNGLEKIKGK